jgi:hypothetical protein
VEEVGQLRAWVEARQGSWNRDDWLALLEALKQSTCWPMQPDAVGLALEQDKQEWLSPDYSKPSPQACRPGACNSFTTEVRPGSALWTHDPLSPMLGNTAMGCPNG